MGEQDMPIVVRHNFDCSLERAWNALTVRKEMVQWFFENIPEFDPRVGFETVFTVSSGGRMFPHRWRIVAVAPQQNIRYRWSYDNYPGEGHVTFAVSESEGKTEVEVSFEGMASFPQDIPEFTPESCRAGWEYFIGERLRDYLANSGA